MTEGGIKRKETEEVEDSLENEPSPKMARLEIVDDENIVNIVIDNEVSEKPHTSSTESDATNSDSNKCVLCKNVNDWSAEELEKIHQTFKISTVENTHIDTVMSPFSKVQVPEKYQEYIDALEQSFEELHYCQMESDSIVDQKDCSEILPETVLNEIITRLRSAKEKLSDNTFARFPAAVSFLNDLKILSRVKMENVGRAHIQMLFHSLLQSAGLQVRSGCDYTSQEEIFGQKFLAEPDMRMYAENHMEFKEPKITATVKVGPADNSAKEETKPSESVIAQAVGELLLDFRNAHYPHELFGFVVQKTKVWLLRLRRCTENLSEADRCRILVDREFRFNSFMKSEKELLISQPLDYLSKEERAKLYKVFAKFASVAGFAAGTPLPSTRRKLYTK